MATSNYFNFYEHAGQQALLEDQIEQTISVAGINVYLMERKESSSYDDLLGEDIKKTMETSSPPIDVYVKQSQQLSGSIGDTMSLFGLEFKDNITLVVGKRNYSEIMQKPDNSKPVTGSIIYIPLVDTLFEIIKVSEDEELLKTGRNMVWEMFCEIVTLGHDQLDNVIPDIADASLPIDPLLDDNILEHLFDEVTPDPDPVNHLDEAHEMAELTVNPLG